MGELLFLSTLSLRRATARRASRQQPAGISIHALLAESDIFLVQLGCKSFLFLSTLSLRRATSRIFLDLTFHEHFYPRSPCGERPLLCNADCNYRSISIHALLAESDQLVYKRCKLGRKFLSTLSLRRATYAANAVDQILPDFYPRSPCGERLYGP